MPFKVSEINWLAVAVAGLIAFLVGGVWYTALFGQLWIKLQGYSPEQVKEMQAQMSPPIFLRRIREGEPKLYKASWAEGKLLFPMPFRS